MVRIKKNNFVYKKNIYQCIVPGCQNIDNDTNDPSIFYYIITENRLNQKSLIEFLENIPIRPKVSRICSEHFTNDCFQLQRGIKMLKPNAVPTIKSKTKPRILIDKTDFINRTGALDKISNNNNEKIDSSEKNNTKHDDKILMRPPQTPVVKKSQIQILKDIIISPQIQLQPEQQPNSTLQKQQQNKKSSHQQPEQQQKQLDNSPHIQKLLKNNIELILVPLQQQQPNNGNLKQLQQVVQSPHQQNNKQFNNWQEPKQFKQQSHQKEQHLSQKSQHNVSQNLQQGNLKPGDQQIQITLRQKLQLHRQLEKNSVNLPHKQNIVSLENRQKRVKLTKALVQPPNPVEKLQKPQNNNLKGKRRRKENIREHNESLKKLAQRVKLTHQHQKLKQLQSPRTQSIFSVEEHNEYLEQLQQSVQTPHQQQPSQSPHQQQSRNKTILEHEKQLDPSQQQCKEGLEQVQRRKQVQKNNLRQECVQKPKQLQEKSNVKLSDKKKHNTRLSQKKHNVKSSSHLQQPVQSPKLQQRQHKQNNSIQLSHQQPNLLTQPNLQKQQPSKQNKHQPTQSHLQKRQNSFTKESIFQNKSKHKQQELEAQLKIKQPIQLKASSQISHEKKHLIICANISFESCKNNFSYLCNFCSTNFENLNAFSAHLIRLHSTEIENEINSKTSNNSCTTTRIDNLKQNGKKQTCGSISISSETYSNLIFNCDFKFDCNFCDKKFKNIIEFSEHMGKNHLELLEKDKENCMELEDDIDIDPSCILSFDQIDEIDEFNPKFNSTMMSNNNNNNNNNSNTNINNKIIMSVPISDNTEIFMTIDINENHNNNNTNLFNNNINNKNVKQQQQQQQQHEQHIPMEVDIIEKPKFKLNIKHSSWATRYFN